MERGERGERGERVEMEDGREREARERWEMMGMCVDGASECRYLLDGYKYALL